MIEKSEHSCGFPDGRSGVRVPPGRPAESLDLPGEDRPASRQEPSQTVAEFTQNSHRLYALDALRLVAALAVVLHHWLRVTPAEVQALPIYPSSFAWHGGYFGVTLFFAISGFVILMSASGATARSFVFARVVRLYPAFWICCAITWLACWNSPGAVTRGDFIVNLTMFPTAAGAMPVDSVYWTLAVEARFYLLIAVLLATGRKHQLGAVLWVWLALDAWVDAHPVRTLLALDWAPFFVVGCAAYMLRSRPGWRPIALLLAGTVSACVHAAHQAGVHARTYRVPDDAPAFVLVTLLMVALLVAISRGWIRLPRSRAVMAAGAMSYPLYLLHKEVGWWGLKQWEHLPGLPLFAAALGGILLLSWAVAHWIEPAGQRALRGVLTRNIKAET